MEIGGWRRGHPTNPAHCADSFFFFFFFQRVCMNGLLITQHADIISISSALFFSPIGISGLQSKGGKTVKVVGALHNERAVNYIPR